MVAVAVAEEPVPYAPRTVIVAAPFPGNAVRVTLTVPGSTRKEPHVAPPRSAPQETVTFLAPAGTVNSTVAPSAAEGPRFDASIVYVNSPFGDD